MEFSKECEPQDLISGSNDNRTVLSEDALRQLSKSLTGLIPNNVDSPEKGAFAYGFYRQAEEDY